MPTPAPVAAVDVGGTAVKGALVRADGRELRAAGAPTPRQAGPEAVLTAVRSVIAELVRAQPVAAVGLVVPGEVSGGVARYSANLGWRDIPADAFADGLVPAATPVVLDHDVRAAALAERTVGATVGVAEHCVVVLGTGIAAVSVVDGRPVRGARSLAGELGHVSVRPGGEPCACGQLGCLEVYASAAAVARRYSARTGRSCQAHDVVSGLGSDADADAVWADAIAALATACATVTMLQDPSVIVFAGGLAEAGAALLTPLAAQLAALLTWRPSPRLVASPLGSRAGRHGAALLAFEAARLPVDLAAWTGVLR